MVALLRLPRSDVVVHQLHYRHRVDVLSLLQVADTLQGSREALLARLDSLVNCSPDLVIEHTQIEVESQALGVVGLKLAPLLFGLHLSDSSLVDVFALFLEPFESI